MKEFWIKWRREIVRGGFLFFLVFGLGILAFTYVKKLRDRVSGIAAQVGNRLSSLRNLNLDVNIDGNFDDAGRTHGDPWTWHGPLGAGKKLSIQNVNGPIVVTTGASRDVVVTTEKSWNRSDSASVRLVVVESASGVTVCAVWPGSSAECGRPALDSLRHHRGPRPRRGPGNDVAVKFTVEVPQGVKVDATTVNGEINVTGPSAVSASTVNGDVTADAGGLPLKLNTVNGDVTATERSVGADSESVNTVNGDITLAIPLKASLVIDASTVTGDIETGFGMPVNSQQYSPGHTLHGSLGAGTGRLAINTVRGDISVQPIGTTTPPKAKVARAVPAAAIPPQPR